jgi:hypothetical protein
VNNFARRKENRYTTKNIVLKNKSTKIKDFKQREKNNTQEIKYLLERDDDDDDLLEQYLYCQSHLAI